MTGPALRDTSRPVAAIDLGATSGRVMIGELRDGRVVLETVHRFENGPCALRDVEPDAPDDALAWDIDRIWADVRTGLRLAFERRPDIASIGIDSWAVDYALVRDGSRIGEVRHYRDPRNQRAVPRLEEFLSREELFRINGLQFLPFNTMYQLEAERPDPRVSNADTLLLVPDYLSWLLTGTAGAERTNASTTGLLDVRTGEWNRGLAEHLGVSELLPPIVEPGSRIGDLLPEWAREFGAAGNVSVVAVASHDTASAVAAVPLESGRAAYVSCGTWGLAGVELRTPVVTDSAREAAFTNEIGIDGTVRFLKNVTGTWLLSESIRFWNEHGWRGDPVEVTLEALLEEASGLPVPDTLIDAADERFLAPGDVPDRVVAAVTEAGGAAPRTPAEVIRLVIESLAASFASETAHAAAQAEFERDAIHIVGGGSQGELLCQRTADLAGVPVIAGPVECTALGNVLVQLRANSGAAWTMGDMRDLVRSSVDLRRYEPAASR